jgi:uncharacterized repeat protein (TIGR04052 family)
MRAMSFVLGLAIQTIPVWASQAAAPLQQSITISFGLAAGGESVDCGHDLKGVGKQKVDAKLHDARVYISTPALIDGTGKEVPIELEKNDWQYANVALLNFAGKTGSCNGMSALNDSIKGTVPPGRYRGLSFIVGVPSFVKGDDGKDVVLNHSNFATAPAPLDIQAMAWNWQAGRKFMKIEVDPAGGVTRQPSTPKTARLASNETPAPGASDANARPDIVKSSDIVKLDAAKSDPSKSMEPSAAEPTKLNPDGTITVATWMLHLGSTGCKGDPLTGEITSCASANRISARLASFDPEKQRVILDLGSLLSETDLNRDWGGATGCMSAPSDPECGPIFEKLGLNLKETAVDANDAGKPSKNGSQIFRAETKHIEQKK